MIDSLCGRDFPRESGTSFFARNILEAFQYACMFDVIRRIGNEKELTLTTFCQCPNNLPPFGLLKRGRGIRLLRGVRLPFGAGPMFEIMPATCGYGCAKSAERRAIEEAPCIRKFAVQDKSVFASNPFIERHESIRLKPN